MEGGAQICTSYISLYKEDLHLWTYRYNGSSILVKNIVTL